MDFQSTALPTELQNHLGRPNLANMCSLSRCKEDITNVFSFFLDFLLDLVVDELNWAVSTRGTCGMVSLFYRRILCVTLK